jgi:hypothetical protein
MENNTIRRGLDFARCLAMQHSSATRSMALIPGWPRVILLSSIILLRIHRTQSQDVAVGQHNAAMLLRHAVTGVWLSAQVVRTSSGSGSSARPPASHGTPDCGRPHSEAIVAERLLVHTWLKPTLLKDDQARLHRRYPLNMSDIWRGGGSRFHSRMGKRLHQKKKKTTSVDVAWYGNTTAEVATASWHAATRSLAAQHILSLSMPFSGRVQRMP